MKDTMMKDVDLSKAYQSATDVKENIDLTDQAEWDLSKAYPTAEGIISDVEW